MKLELSGEEDMEVEDMEVKGLEVKEEDFLQRNQDQEQTTKTLTPAVSLQESKDQT